MESEESNNSFEQQQQTEEVMPVEKAESVTSETSMAASTSSHKMKIDEITGEDNDMEVDSISNSVKPNSKNKTFSYLMIFIFCIL